MIKVKSLLMRSLRKVSFLGGGGGGEEAPTGGKPKLWSNVVRDHPTPINNVVFDYCPPPAGSKVVSPPDEVLKEGIDKFSNCIVGTFSKGTYSYKSVVYFARAAQKNSLVSVAQKETNVFIFRFKDAASVHSILLRGTWYFGNRPLLVKPWGVVASQKIESIPLWVKFSKIPDCYWTRRGLSHLASVIGTPLSADEMTSKLDILPFAKICVEYKIGDELPDRIEVEDLDPVSGDKSIKEILVQYQCKQLICSVCHSLGHTVGACPQASRRWVRKVRLLIPNDLTEL
ncbi:hypothetical protein POM88_035778 [Heracleum sosnowskyi]|uniref:DUF4283 domain-containing protein n=1 Tax=Heracleum sosnowskyi TaxID=360622 RepID=A0AAD8HN26_9APIA|nr:hypothetical protein POM88_035778 [Heracleum sosnowskyi]